MRTAAAEVDVEWSWRRGLVYFPPLISSPEYYDLVGAKGALQLRLLWDIGLGFEPRPRCFLACLYSDQNPERFVRPLCETLATPFLNFINVLYENPLG